MNKAKTIIEMLRTSEDGIDPHQPRKKNVKNKINKKTKILGSLLMIKNEGMNHPETSPGVLMFVFDLFTYLLVIIFANR